jgi:purine-nucleoside phosphorylase
MIIKDHISFAGMAGQNPLIGPNLNAFGPRFPPISSAYDFDMRVIAAKASVALQLQGIREGNYSYVGIDI